MKLRTAVLTAAVVAAVAGGAAATAAASSASSPAEEGEAGSSDVTAQQAEDATDAALEATGGGTANSVERDSENGATWEVEVTRADGATVDVRLDDDYDVVVIEGDSETADE